MMMRSRHIAFATRLVAISALMLAWLASPVAAQTGRYYLVAQVAPEGSISSGGQAKSVVYLRWDSLEGRLPDDVERIQLVRGGNEVLVDQPVDAVMGVAGVEALYAGPAQERRLVETLRGLKELAVSEDRDFAVGDFATAIQERVDPASEHFNSAWSFLASRGDVNVARARYRAFVDDPGAGEFEYELRAVATGGGATATLGRATVNTLTTYAPLAPSVFRQVLQAECHLPEAGLDHYTVALDWDSPGGGNAADRVASQIYLAGYDLYRTPTNLDPLALSAPARDVRAEAAAAGFDNRGEPTLAGLEKVNDTLLTIDGDAQTEPAWSEWVGAIEIAGGLVPEWIETQDQLAQAGLRPGDKRAYYLVPRDFTGNYGPTLAAVVVVPNEIRPPAPWELRDFVDQTGQLTIPPQTGLAISWDDVNVDNYLETYRGSRRFCNLSEAKQTGVLEFVAEGEDCDADVRRRVRLDVADYRVYRFDGFDEAASFKDSDGDGVSDLLEEPFGMQCDAAQQPAGSEPRALPHSATGLSEVVMQSGREIIRFRDLAPQTELGEVFWYRVASVTPDGRLSHLSAPQRGLFPDRAPPLEPIVTMLGFGREEDGGCELAVDRTAGAWRFSEHLDARRMKITCGTGEFIGTLSAADIGTDAGMCQTVLETCGQASGGTLTLDYPEKTSGGDPYTCSITIPDDLPPEDQDLIFCGAGGARLVPTYRDTLEPIETGDFSPQFGLVGVSRQDPDTCVTLYENIDGAYTKAVTSCGDASDPSYVQHVVESGFFCGYAVAQDENNNISQAVHTPCTRIELVQPKPPATPQPVDFGVDDRVADIGWRLPIEPVAVTLVRLEHRRGDGTRSRTIDPVPSPGQGGGDVVYHAIDVPALVGDRDEWCVSFLAVGPNAEGSEALSSDWSAPRCVHRRSDGVDVPEYLPWPAVSDAPEGRPLQAGAMGIPGIIGLIYVDVARVKPVDASTLLRNCLFGSQPSFFLDTKCAEEGKLASDAMLAPVLDFVVYRQHREEGGDGSDWVQVSPLIEFAHWDGYEPTPEEPKFLGRYLRDPYIHLRRNDLEDDQIRAWAFVDRYPYRVDLEYRYQLVYFSADHRIVQTRTSDWVDTGFAGDLGDFGL